MIEEKGDFCPMWGDEASELIASNYRIAMSYLLKKEVKREEAEEIVQEAALRAYKNFGRFRRESSFTLWFLRIVRNHAYNKARKKKPHLTSDGDLSRFSGEEDPLEELLKKSLTTEIRGALEQLRPRDREILYLRFFEDLSYKDIAEKLSVPIGSVKSGLYRAKERLGLVYEAHLGTMV